jgi:2-iminobutanoate/2-iminopropanoate deaminase
MYVSCQGPIDPDSGEIVAEDVRQQTGRTLENVDAILAAGGVSLDDVVKATVFVSVDDYDTVNDVDGEYMSEPDPARSAVQVSDLPGPIRLETEVIAAVPE